MEAVFQKKRKKNNIKRVSLILKIRPKRTKPDTSRRQAARKVLRLFALRACSTVIFVLPYNIFLHIWTYSSLVFSCHKAAIPSSEIPVTSAICSGESPSAFIFRAVSLFASTFPFASPSASPSAFPFAFPSASPSAYP